MLTITNETKRTNIGYGSIYRRGKCKDLAKNTAIGTVLRGQIWMVKPDRSAETDKPCLWVRQESAAYEDCKNIYECATCEYALDSREREENLRKAC